MIHDFLLYFQNRNMATPGIIDVSRSIKVMSADNTDTSELLSNNRINSQMNGADRVQYIEVPAQSDSDSEGEVKEKDDSSDAERSVSPKTVEDGDQDFLRTVIDIIFREGLVDTDDRNKKVCEFFKPDELLSKMSDMSIGGGRADTNKLLDLLEQIINHSVKTAHPRFFNQLYGGLSLYSMGGAWISEAVNASL